MSLKSGGKWIRFETSQGAITASDRILVGQYREKARTLICGGAKAA